MKYHSGCNYSSNSPQFYVFIYPNFIVLVDKRKLFIQKVTLHHRPFLPQYNLTYGSSVRGMTISVRILTFSVRKIAFLVRLIAISVVTILVARFQKRAIPIANGCGSETSSPYFALPAPLGRFSVGEWSLSQRFGHLSQNFHVLSSENRILGQKNRYFSCNCLS